MANVESLDVVVSRLLKPGVLSVVLATREGVLLHSSLGSEHEESRKQALHFSRVLDATLAAYKEMGIVELPLLLSFVSCNLEYVLSVGDATGGCFFITCRENKPSVEREGGSKQ